MDAMQLKNAYCLESHHLPNPQGTIVQIEAVDSEYYEQIDNGRKVEKVRHQLYLRGCRLPLRLNNTRVDILVAMLGRETDAWVGRKIGLYVGMAQHYGQTKPSILMHETALDDQEVHNWPEGLAAKSRGFFVNGKALGAARDTSTALARAPGFGEAVGRFTGNTGGKSSVPDEPGQDMSPFGAESATRLMSVIKEVGSSVDALLAVIKAKDQQAYGAMYGRPLEDWPRFVVPHVQQFIRVAREEQKSRDERAKVAELAAKQPAPQNAGQPSGQNFGLTAVQRIVPTDGRVDVHTGEVIPDDEIPF